jgi:hypothetical protein
MNSLACRAVIPIRAGVSAMDATALFGHRPVSRPEEEPIRPLFSFINFFSNVASQTDTLIFSSKADG